MVSAFDKLSIDATGKIDMGVVSEEVHNRYKEWGFKGLGWGSVKQAWNDVDTTVTRLSGNDVSLNAKGPITGTGVKIAAVNDLLMKTDDTIRLEAAQDALYFTEKGFYVGLSFPGSAGIDAALKGGSGGQILSGLAGINPITAKLATLANADNGLAAGLAVVNLATGGLGAFYSAGQSTQGPSLGSPVEKMLDPLGQFRDPGTGQITAGSIAKTVGINLSVWKSEQRWSESQISELTAGGDIVMKAGLDVILDQGTKMVSGGDVAIDAGRDILMAALVDYAQDKSSSFGLQLSLSSIGFDIGKSKGYDETLTNASITAAGNVSLTSGRDTSLLGGNIIGRTVDLDVGRDLTILSPQAQGWRDGFSFGLTVGVNPADWSVRGSKEDGFKAWSSGSGIVAAQGIDIKVAEDTTLVGALLQATDGDISLDTGTLTVADLKDTDQYKNVGGSIGISGGGLNSVGFSYEKKDKQGETRTTLDASGELNVTIRDADKDGVAGTEADKAAAEELLASINKDASKYQEITKDSYTKLSGELDVEALRNLKRNLDFALRYSQAQDAAVPGWIAAEGPHAIDQYREAILYGGATPAEAEELMKTPRFQAMLQERKSFDALKQGALNSEDLLKSIMLIQQGEELYRDPTSGNLMVRTACGTNGPCGVEISKLRLEATETVARFIEQRLEKGDDAALQEALECALAYALVRGDVSHFETLKSSGKFDAVAIQKYADAATSIVGSNLQNEAPALAADGIDITMALTKIVMASENGRIDAAQFNQLIDILKTDGPSGQAASFRIAVALGTLGDAGSAYLKALSHRMLDDYVADAAAEQQVHKFIAENPDSPQAKEVKQLLAQGIAMSVAMAAIGVRFYDGKFESVKGTTGRFENVKAQNIDEEQFIANVKTTFSNSTVWTGVTRHNGELVVQRSDIELSPQNVILMKNGQAPFVRGADGNWEPVQLHHVGRETGQLIEVTRSQNAYNSVNGGPLHIPGPGGPVRQSGYSQSYWKQRYQSFVSSGQIVP
ncbi:hemagglutinin repeat-containing protein [Agrobacterium deltaense]|uniref:hemagglutinin repeat-containing protein n=1 Tax=Agrobacterium deltaense TaxID=1183412 RepID=UPI001CB78843|nr:hemagglutinin repeat-containing protein [Agrobacterium deltaense]